VILRRNCLPEGVGGQGVPVRRPPSSAEGHRASRQLQAFPHPQPACAVARASRDQAFGRPGHLMGSKGS
jgi:hypothetical protein